MTLQVWEQSISLSMGPSVTLPSPTTLQVARHIALNLPGIGTEP